MNKVIIILFIAIISLSISLLSIAINSLYKIQIQKSYRSGYEQCAFDTSLYLQIYPDHCGINMGLRDRLEVEKPQLQTLEAMIEFIDSEQEKIKE